MLPPSVYSNPFQAQFQMAPAFSRGNQGISTSKVLNAISGALNKSLQNYQEKCAQIAENSEGSKKETSFEMSNT